MSPRCVFLLRESSRHAETSGPSSSAFLPDTGSKHLFYLYDFGDNWRHELTALEVVSMPQRFVRRLLAGERAFPPEDCGGIPGYESCVAVALDKATGEIDDAELRGWLGDWRPDQFDLAATKKRFDL